MRTCMIVYSFYDMDYRVIRYAEALREKGNQVDVISIRRQGQTPKTVINGVNVYRKQTRLVNEKGLFSYIGRHLIFFLRAMFLVSRLHLKNPYDLIHVHNIPDFLVFTAWLPKLKGAKIILDIHDLVPEFYIDKFKKDKVSLLYKSLLLMERLSVMFSDHVIISNHIWEKRLLSRSAKQGKCTTVMNYPNTSIFSRHTGRQNSGKQLILYPGTLNAHQGLDVAIKAFAAVKDLIPKAEFHIYGEGPAKESLIQLVSQEGLQDRVFFMGLVSIDEIAAVMAQADLGVVPKRSSLILGDEAFSTKILEFMALGVPVIVTDTKIDRFYFDESQVKFFKSDDTKDLAECIVSLLKDEKLRNKLRTNSLEYVKKNNWNLKKGVYLDLLNALLNH